MSTRRPLRRLSHTAATRLRRVHLALAIFWGPIMITLTVFGPLRRMDHSVLWLICISYYANMAAHLSGWAGESATIAAEATHDHLDHERISKVKKKRG